MEDLYKRSTDPTATFNRAGAHVCNAIELLSGGVLTAVASASLNPTPEGKAEIPDHLGENNFRRVKGAHRAELNEALDKHGHIKELDRLIRKYSHLQELKDIEHLALVKPLAAADKLVNWYGTLAWEAPDSEFYDESHEKKRIRR